MDGGAALLLEFILALLLRDTLLRGFDLVLQALLHVLNFVVGVFGYLGNLIASLLSKLPQFLFFLALILTLLLFILCRYLLQSLVDKLVNGSEISLEAASDIALTVIVTGAKHHLLEVRGLGYATAHRLAL